MTREQKIEALKAYAAGDRTVLEKIHLTPLQVQMPDDFFYAIVSNLNAGENIHVLLDNFSKCKTQAEADSFFGQWRKTKAISKKQAL